MEWPAAAGGPGVFKTTRWSLVLAAGGGTPGQARKALGELCAEYWYPIYAYARRRGNDVEQSRDLTQAFFTKLLEKQDLAAATPSRGRFRSFLLTAMKHFMAGEWRKQQAQKRGGAFEVLALDFDSAEDTYRLEPALGQDPEALYHRRWALDLLDRALGRLESHYRKSDRGDLFEALKDVVVGGDVSLPYAEIAARLDRSEGSLRTAASRMRSRWRQELRGLVAETVDSEAEIETELQALVAALSA